MTQAYAYAMSQEEVRVVLWEIEGMEEEQSMILQWHALAMAQEVVSYMYYWYIVVEYLLWLTL